MDPQPILDVEGYNGVPDNRSALDLTRPSLSSSSPAIAKSSLDLHYPPSPSSVHTPFGLVHSRMGSTATRKRRPMNGLTPRIVQVRGWPARRAPATVAHHQCSPQDCEREPMHVKAQLCFVNKVAAYHEPTPQRAGTNTPSSGAYITTPPTGNTNIAGNTVPQLEWDAWGAGTWCVVLIGLRDRGGIPQHHESPETMVGLSWGFEAERAVVVTGSDDPISAPPDKRSRSAMGLLRRWSGHLGGLRPNVPSSSPGAMIPSALPTPNVTSLPSDGDNDDTLDSDFEERPKPQMHARYLPLTASRHLQGLPFPADAHGELYFMLTRTTGMICKGVLQDPLKNRQ
ncbi:hypothetical protein C8R44DRAFT_892460 [Mycena epipterygia]|nr:hypothetical protein C8R44DRAFT_892460 [Mycena epipterygia]